MSDFSPYIFTPLEVANAGYNEALRVKEAGKKGFNLPHIDGCDAGEYFARLMPWEVCEVLAQTHNGKTTFVDWWETEVARQFVSEERDEAIVHVSLEESLEAMSFYQHAKVLNVSPSEIANGEIDFTKLQFSVSVVSGINIYRIAESSSHDDDDFPELYLSNIYRIIKSLRDGEVTGSPVKIGGVFLDYLQALPYDPETRKENEDGKRRIQVRKDVYRLREMCVHIPAPIVVCVQAKQHLDGNNPPYYIPGMYDGEETSSIAQRFDRILTLWMPKNNYPAGSTHSTLGVIKENEMWLKANKQRGGFPSGKSWLLKWDFNEHSLTSATGASVAEKDARVSRWQKATE